MSRPNWSFLDVVLDAAELAGVSFSIHYCESDNSWYGAVSSAAPSEETVTKSGSFVATCERLIEHCERISGRG